MSKRYKLLRDLPETKKDTPYLFCSQPGGEDYYMPVSATNPSVAAEGKIYRAALVESSPDFWELIPEASEQVKNIEEDYKRVCDELRVTDQLLQERQLILDAIPECSIHGGNCVPHAIEWVNKKKAEHPKDGIWNNEDMARCWSAAIDLVEWIKEKNVQEKFPKPPTRYEFMKLLKASKQSQQRKPLFRTEDGKEIFEGDEYWWVHKATLSYNKISGAHDLSGKDKGFAYFSTKEAAESYAESYAELQPTIHHGEDNLQYISSQPETGCPTIDRQEQKVYTKSEYEEAIRKAFDAARETFKGDNVSTQNTKFLRYTNAAYYLQCVTCIHH